MCGGGCGGGGIGSSVGVGVKEGCEGVDGEITGFMASPQLALAPIPSLPAGEFCP